MKLPGVAGLLTLAVSGLVFPKPFGALAQSRVVAVPTEFDAASVKPNREGNGVRGGCHGGDLKLTPNDAMALIPQGRCVISAGRLSHIMSIAYEFPVARIHGESSLSWGNDRFDIEAKAENAATPQRELLIMLQSLIADRFKLKIHRETRTLKGYELLAAKNGTKLKKPSDDGAAGLVGRGAAINKFDAMDGKNKDLNSLTGRRTTMAELAAALTNLPGSGPVVDRTGLTGTFDFHHQWEPEESVNSVLQQQLGLRLEAAQVPVEFIVIDSAQRPAEN